MKAFDPKWCDWINQFLHQVSVASKVNDDIAHYFHTPKGLRQEDPLSPMIFNIVLYMLTVLIALAKEYGQVDNLSSHLVECGASILQYTNYTLIFMEHDPEKALNMKLILCIFEQLFSLKINFLKSEICRFNQAKYVEEQYTKLGVCWDHFLLDIWESLLIFTN